MTDANRYADAFQGMLDQLDKEVAAAQQEVATFARLIKSRKELPVGRRMQLRRRLLKLETDRVIRGDKGPMRNADALWADPVSSSNLLIPELTGRILHALGERAGQLLLAAFRSGFVTVPDKLWARLNCPPDRAEPSESLWTFAVGCLRESHTSKFKSAAGEWRSIEECRIALELIIRALVEADVDSTAVKLMRDAISGHQKKEKAPRTVLARSGGNYQNNLKALNYLHSKGEYAHPSKKQKRGG